MEVDLVAVEVEQLGVDHRRTGLPGGLHDQAGDGLALVDDHDALAGDHPRRLERRRVLDLDHDVERAILAARRVGQRQQGLDHLAVGLVAVGGEHDDRAGALVVADPQVADVDRRAGPADHAGAAEVAGALADLLLHLDLVLGGEDHDRGALAALVGDRELAEDRHDRVGPAEDQRVVLLQHPRAAAAQLHQAGVDPGRDHADQGADHEQAGDRQDQHRQQEPPRAAVAGDGAGVERVHQAVEQLLADAGAGTVVVLRGDPGGEHQDAEDHDQGQGQDGEPADERRRPAGHAGVEAVARSLADPWSSPAIGTGARRTIGCLVLLHGTRRALSHLTASARHARHPTGARRGAQPAVNDVPLGGRAYDRERASSWFRTRPRKRDEPGRSGLEGVLRGRREPPGDDRSSGRRGGRGHRAPDDPRRDPHGRAWRSCAGAGRAAGPARGPASRRGQRAPDRGR